MVKQLCLPFIPVGYITPEEALRRRLITKAEHERIVHGGLTEKQHTQMLEMARRHNEEFRRKVLSGEPTTYGIVDPSRLYPQPPPDGAA